MGTWINNKSATAIKLFDVSPDGCEAKRANNAKKNKKWKLDSGSTHTPAIHPFKKPEEYKKCMEET